MAADSEDFRSSSPYALFSGFGVEAEYMIVDRDTFAVSPLCDRLLARFGDDGSGEITLGDVGCSNELALHVVELKTDGPTADFEGTARRFREELATLEHALGEWNACLLPGAMHPTMNPERELRLWPLGSDVVYRTFDRIFDCRGHGWANLQSVHVNFPFQTAEDFGRLHAALRVVLPLVPALCASSPFVEGRRAAHLSERVAVYRTNAARVPSVSGQVIPERIFTPREYQRDLLEGIYADLAPHDPEGVLAHEWVNARGAIARFDRSAIELRLMDIQECPEEDLARVEFVVALTRALADQRWSDLDGLMAPGEGPLSSLLERTTREASTAILDESWYLELFGRKGATTARALVADLCEELDLSPFAGRRLEHFARRGSLAERLVEIAGTKAPGDPLDEPAKSHVFRALRESLVTGSAASGRATTG